MRSHVFLYPGEATTEASRLVQMTEDSLADLSDFLRVSLKINQEAGGVDVSPEGLAILGPYS